jgi:hypothetical protein
MLNLILDSFDFETAALMFELVFWNKLSKINIGNVDVPKNSLKCLLKI